MLKHLLMLTALLLPVSYANANDYRAAELNIAAPWSMELPPNAPNVAAYFVIHNNGQNADRLLSADTPIAGTAQLHEHVHANGLMKMQQVPNVEVPAGGDAVFAPMGYHVMLLDLKDKAALTEGKTFPLTLHFEKSGEVTVEVEVLKQPPGAPKHSH
ncbi:copper chaperone PCu(A)C [Pseudomonas folii]|uniref:Copper chaperone PCu(A)C n=1 Tax=Pseudomonas folii TaxID=2762593 RepID=A0ABR7B6E2_9PSED|nr:copper chaperone PCu(A)C [Pseudomonas folii]MBC3952747.1 copper chaperone PCu(A)C [Pseudomonas folii]